MEYKKENRKKWGKSIEIKGSGDIYFEAIEDWKSSFDSHILSDFQLCDVSVERKAKASAMHFWVNWREAKTFHGYIWQWLKGRQDNSMPRCQGHSLLFISPFAPLRRNPCLKAVVKKSVEQGKGNFAYLKPIPHQQDSLFLQVSLCVAYIFSFRYRCWKFTKEKGKKNLKGGIKSYSTDLIIPVYTIQLGI